MPNCQMSNLTQQRSRQNFYRIRKGKTLYQRRGQTLLSYSSSSGRRPHPLGWGGMPAPIVKVQTC